MGDKTQKEMIEWANEPEIKNLWYFFRDDYQMTKLLKKVIRLDRAYRKRMALKKEVKK